MTTTPAAEELLVQLDQDDPRCELTYECDEHGREECGGRARWVATVICPGEPDPEQLLICDDCHDLIESDGNVLGTNGDHRVEWRAL